jgi:hypothetical protein
MQMPQMMMPIRCWIMAGTLSIFPMEVKRNSLLESRHAATLLITS